MTILEKLDAIAEVLVGSDAHGYWVGMPRADRAEHVIYNDDMREDFDLDKSVQSVEDAYSYCA